MKKPTIAIGIAAFNEECNIQKLLTSLLTQNIESGILKQIIVISDGSTDNTVKNARSIKSTQIEIVESYDRMGKSSRVNQILEKFNADIIFLLDADIEIVDLNLIEKIIKRTNFQKTGLISVNTIPLTPQGLIEKCINFSVQIQQELRNSWNGGDNFLSFKGCFLGLDRELAKLSKLPDNLINNDGYFYFSAIHLGYKPVYLSECRVLYRSPGNFADHVKQSIRFQKSRNELQNYFVTNLAPYYRIPSILFLKTIFSYFFKNPILFSFYVLINLGTKIYFDKSVNAAWSIASSTKRR